MPQIKTVMYIAVSAKFKDVSKKNPPKNILRWMKLVEAQPIVAKALKELPSDVLDNLSKASTRFVVLHRHHYPQPESTHC